VQVLLCVNRYQGASKGETLERDRGITSQKMGVGRIVAASQKRGRKKKGRRVASSGAKGHHWIKASLHGRPRKVTQKSRENKIGFTVAGNDRVT